MRSKRGGRWINLRSLPHNLVKISIQKVLKPLLINGFIQPLFVDRDVGYQVVALQFDGS